MPNPDPASVSRLYPDRPAPALIVTARKPATYPPPAAVPNADRKRSRIVEPPSLTRLYSAGQRIANAERLAEQPE